MAHNKYYLKKALNNYHPKLIDELTGALKILEQYGWCQNQVTNGREQVCVAGALNQYIAGSPSKFTKGSQKPTSFLEYIIAIITGEYMSLNSWNDAEGRTVNEVKDLLRAGMVVFKLHEQGAL